MADKTVQFTRTQIEEIAKKHPTPFHLYDEKRIKLNARKFTEAFGVLDSFKEYFAVKALPNPYILKLLAKEGFGGDCSSMPELILSERSGIRGEDIMFTSNDTPAKEFVKARELGAIINLDDITHIPYLEQHAGIPEVICMRFNPGSWQFSNVIIGKPEEAKYGFTRQQLFEGYRVLSQKGVKRFGLHTMVLSNELDESHFIKTARMMFELVVEIHKETGVRIEFVNLGGGIGIPYRPDQNAVSYASIANGVRREYDETIGKAGLAPVRVCLECGRVITGPYGYLITEVVHIKDTYKKFVGLDATMANLMRPAMYGAYHHITVLGKDDKPRTETYDVTGSLCENNDKFAIDRELPKIEVGDYLAIHDTGAHGHAMGFNYNGKLRSAELLLREDGSAALIRRAETVEDYFATLDFSGLARF
ncbi:MAG: diaminopimelate decarboxylase [Planctomycetes bacterium]|nr:diaminopimelate decarboxylase [Planctomycetota bacterium]